MPENEPSGSEWKGIWYLCLPRKPRSGAAKHTGPQSRAALLIFTRLTYMKVGVRGSQGGSQLALG